MPVEDKSLVKSNAARIEFGPAEEHIVPIQVDKPDIMIDQHWMSQPLNHDQYGWILIAFHIAALNLNSHIGDMLEFLPPELLPGFPKYTVGLLISLFIPFAYRTFMRTPFELKMPARATTKNIHITLLIPALIRNESTAGMK